MVPKGFKQFVLRGNVVDLAVGLVVGAAFTNIVNSLVKDILNPFIAVLVGKPNFSYLTLVVGRNKFLFGDFLNSIVSFIIVAMTVYFFVVLPLNALVAKSRSGQPVESDTKKCPECLSELPKLARRCAFCTSQI